MAQDLCRKVRELMWQALPDNSALQADDIVSQIGPFKAEDELLMPVICVRVTAG